MKTRILILTITLLVIWGCTYKSFSPKEIKPGEAKIIKQEEGPQGNYLVTSGFVRQYYEMCVKQTGNPGYCERRVLYLVVSENLDGTWWVKPEMIEQMKRMIGLK